MRAVHRAGTRERPEIIALQRPRAAMLGDLRRLLVAADDDVGKRFVVAERDVVARLEALDEVGFEQQRFRLGRGVHELHRHRGADHRRDAVGMAGEPRVILHAVLEVARLADIDDLTGLIHHAVDAGAGAEVLDVARNRLRAAYGLSALLLGGHAGGALFNPFLAVRHARFIANPARRFIGIWSECLPKKYEGACLAERGGAQLCPSPF